MIVSFSVTNFRSIRDKVEISLEKTKLRGLTSNSFKGPGKLSLLHSAIIYGPNASGKSSFLMAFKALEFIIRSSTSFKPGQEISAYEPFKLDKSYTKQPVIFEIEFITKGIRYQYVLSFSSQAIEKEELSFYPNGVKTNLYTRARNKDLKFGEAYRGGKKTIERLLLDNQLFLSKAAENNAESVFNPYQFFTEGIMVFPFLETYRESQLSRLYAKKLAADQDSTFAKRFNLLICALDTGIRGVTAVEVEWDNYQFPSNMPDDLRAQFQEQYKYDIKTQHPVFEGDKEVGIEHFEIEEESTGTKSLFVIGGIILDALEAGRVLVVDQFEKNLHPSITQFLISLFHNPYTNPQNAQLVFATHDITQLSHDTFRRDQVWFTEKSEAGATVLYRCSDITGVRLGTPLDKWYASGRFGATPIIQDTDFFIAMQSHEA